MFRNLVIQAQKVLHRAVAPMKRFHHPWPHNPEHCVLTKWHLNIRLCSTLLLIISWTVIVPCFWGLWEPSFGRGATGVCKWGDGIRRHRGVTVIVMPDVVQSGLCSGRMTPSLWAHIPPRGSVSVQGVRRATFWAISNPYPCGTPPILSPRVLGRQPSGLWVPRLLPLHFGTLWCTLRG